MRNAKDHSYRERQDIYKLREARLEWISAQYGRTTYTLNKVNNLALVAYRPSRRSRIWRRQILDLREIQLTDAISSNQVGGNEKYQRRFVGIR